MSEWQGITIRDLLERVDLLNFISPAETTLNKEKKLGEREQPPPDSSSAFLGPKLWDRSISLPLIGEEEEEEGVRGVRREKEEKEDEEEEEEEGVFDVMNFEDFFRENNLRLEDPDEPVSMDEELTKTRPNIILHTNQDFEKAGGKTTSGKAVGVVKGSTLPRGNNDFLYTESKRSRLEREKAERKRKLEEELEFSPEDLALATVPGLNFNPKERSFGMEELRPQPIIKKRSRTFIPDERKDETYWERRVRNNVAARRSREARRLKENQIALRAAFLEKENKILKRDLEDSDFQTTKLTTELNILKKKLAMYEKGGTC